MSTILLPFLRRLSLVLALGVAAIACEQPQATFNFSVECCIDSARSMRFDINFNTNTVPVVLTKSSNVADVAVDPAAPGQYVVVAHVDEIALHEVVDFTFRISPGQLGSTPQEAAISNVVFYPTSDPGPDEPCPPSGIPTVTVLDDTGCGARIEFANTHNPAPVYVPLVQMATAPEALDEADLHWGDAVLESLNWCNQFTNEFVLINPFDHVFSICLNETSAQCGGSTIAMRDGTATGVVLLRFESLYNGLQHRGIVQIDLAGGHTVRTEETTWGRVKVLYRN